MYRREWCSAQRIRITMIAGGNHSIIQMNGSPTVGFGHFDHSERIPKLSTVNCQFGEAAEQQFVAVKMPPLDSAAAFLQGFDGGGEGLGQLLQGEAGGALGGDVGDMDKAHPDIRTPETVQQGVHQVVAHIGSRGVG